MGSSLSEDSVVTKKSRNDIPEEIIIENYDYFRIGPFGIDYFPEHGGGRDVVRFNNFFKL